MTSTLLTALASKLDVTVSKVKRLWSKLKLAYETAYIKFTNTGIRSQSRHFDAMGFLEHEIKLELLQERFEMAHKADNCVFAAAEPSCDGYEHPSDTYEDSTQIPVSSATGDTTDQNNFAPITDGSTRGHDGGAPPVDPSSTGPVASCSIGVKQP